MIIRREPPKPPNRLPAPPTEPNDLLYEATRLLLRGRRFERAVEMLTEAAKQDPNDYRYWSVRGAAQVSRIASLAYAAAFTEQLAAEHAAYPKAVQAWREAQKDSESDEYGEPMPKRPPVRTFPIKDDGQPYRLTPEQVRRRIAELSEAALVSFREGEKRARNSVERADAAYLHGWGLRLLTLFVALPDLLDIGVGASESEDDDSPPKRKPLVAVPSSEEILTVFTRARDLQPDNPLYWRGVGDMLRHNEGALPSDEDDEIDAVYRRAAELARRDATLWYLLFNRELKKDFGEPNDPEGKKADRDKALFYLRQAQKADPANAWLHYEEAALQFRRTKHSLFTAPAALSQSPEAQVSREKYYGTLLEQDARDTGKQALAATIRANNIVNCFLPLYLPAVPKVFAAAWSYIGWQEELSNVFLWYARFRELARALTGYALFLVEQDKNLLEAVKACRAAVAIGQRLEGDWPIKDKHLGDDSAIRVLVGHALVGMGMKQWIIVEQIAGTPERAAAVQREYDAFQERVKRHKALVSKTIDNMNPVDYY